MTEKIDIVRFSQKALPIAKTFDVNKSDSLEHDEYQKFITIWQESYKNESPLLMQLHISSLTEEAKAIAEMCDKDEIKGVLTGTELKAFMDEYDKSGLETPFKEGCDLDEILNGQGEYLTSTKKEKKKTGFGLINLLKSGYQLFKNLVKRDQMNFKGSDKYFHAVANFEGVNAGSEESVKKLCDAQDQFKRKHFNRCEADYAEDLYANWLGREMAKIHPDANPHDLFSSLAPTGFDTEKSKTGWVELLFDNGAKNVIKNMAATISGYINESVLAKNNDDKRKNYIVQTN